MSKLSEYKISVTSTPTKISTSDSVSDEDPLTQTPVSPNAGNRSFDLNTMLSGGEEANHGTTVDDAFDNQEDFDDDDSISFELYEDGFVREKVIQQIKQAIGSTDNSDSFDISKFLLDHYKYRDLGDLSSGFASLIEEIDSELIENVNENYLSFINLGKSIDGSFDLIHDVKIELSDYLKNLRLSNESIDKDMTIVSNIDLTKRRLNGLKNNLLKVITLSEMIECFDKLCVSFTYDQNSVENIREMISLYFSIGKLIEKLNKAEIELDVVKNLNKKLNDLKLEFRSLVKEYLEYVKVLPNEKDSFFEVFKIYQTLRFNDKL